ncbi:MAG: hypothetical protein NVSMB57_13590 [Actinomycetota bacterium]
MRRATVLLVLVTLSMAACSKAENEKDKGEASASTKACGPAPAAIANPKLPAGFPSLPNVTWSSTKTAAATTIATGYAAATLDATFTSMKATMARGDYKLGKSEKDAHDAEVGFTSAKNDCQIRLGEECEGRTSVTLTIRPKP